MRRIVVRSCVATAAMLLAATAAAAPFSEAWSRQPGLRKRFPGFAARKSTLGSIAVVADVADLRGPGRKPDRIYVRESAELTQRLADALVRELGRKGYAVVAGPRLTLGSGADDDRKCRVLSSKDREDAEWDSAPQRTPPYDVDSTRIASDSLRTAWRRLVRRTMDGAKPEGRVPRGAPSPDDSVAVAALRPMLGGDAILVVGGLSEHKSGLTFGPVPKFPGDEERVDASRIRIALFDARTGAVLWADATDDMRTFSLKRMDAIAEDLAAQLP